MKSLTIYHAIYKPEDQDHEDLPFEVFKRVRSKNNPSLAQNSVALFKGNLRMEIQAALLHQGDNTTSTNTNTKGSIGIEDLSSVVVSKDDEHGRIRSLSENALVSSEHEEMKTREEAVSHLSRMKTPEIHISAPQLALPPPPILDYTTLMSRIERVRDGKDSYDLFTRDLEQVQDSQLQTVAYKMLELLNLHS